MPKIQVGDKFVVLPTTKPHKQRFVGMIFTVTSVNSNGKYGESRTHYCVSELHNCVFVWFEDEIKPLDEPTPVEPITVNVNVTININHDNYDNACWYCRKGGLVDRYFDGKPGICPHCNRVCNSVEQMTKSHKPVNPFKKKENKPLTLEELEALPSGTRVFTVWKKKDGSPDWSSVFTVWRTKDNADGLYWASGYVKISQRNLDRYYDAYLEEPERPIPEPELPF
jgi:hypothetical protein